MQNCPRCGQQVYPNTPTCPRCGLALTPAATPYAAGGAGDAAPDWMRQVQPSVSPAPMPGYGQPPQMPSAPAPYGPPGGEPAGNFPVGSLISEDALPEWMRQAGNGGAPNGAQQGTSAAPWGAPAPNWPPQGYPQQPPAPVPPAGPLFDQSALPAWMRQAPVGPDVAGQATMHAPAPAPGYPSAQPGGPFPSIDQAGAGTPRVPGGGAGMAAQSLLDSSAVPNWLTGEPGPPAGPGNYGGTQPVGDGLSAQVLIDERALPQWLRTEPDAPPPPTPGAGPGLGAGTSVAQWLTASATEERPPAWLDQMYTGAHIPPAPALPPTSQNGSPAGGVAPRQGSLPAGQFVDDAALPSWLRAQGAPESPGAVPEMPYGSTGRVPAPSANAWGTPGAGPTGAGGQNENFSAADLVDRGAMPAWLGGDQAPQQPSAGNGAGGWAQPSGGLEDPTGYMGAAPNAPAPGGQLANHELPPWLRDGPGGAAPGNMHMPNPPAPPSQWQDQNAGRMPGGQLADQQWPSQQWDDGYEQGGYPPGNGYPPPPAYPPQQGYPPTAGGWGASAGPPAYPGYDEQGGYGQYDEYADYGGYDPNGYGYAEDQPRQPSPQQQPGGWRRIFRRK